jgi:Flp pilus assembly pilin Flp
MSNSTVKQGFVLAFCPSRQDDGQALVEYALILLLVALVTVGAVTAIGGSVSAAINAMAAAL